MKKIFNTIILLALATVPAMSEQFDDGIAHKPEVRFDLGAGFGTHDDQAFLLDVGAGYNFTSNIYAGLSTGFYPNIGVVTGAKAPAYLPILGNIQFRVNDTQEDRWSFLFGIKAGILKSMKAEGTLDVGTMVNGEPADGSTTYKFRNYKYVELLPGCGFRTKRNIDYRLSIGACMLFPGSDGLDPNLTPKETMVVLKLGIGLRGKPKSASRKEVHKQQMEETARMQKAELEAIKVEQAEKQRMAEERAAQERQRTRQKREANARAISGAAGTIK